MFFSHPKLTSFPSLPLFCITVNGNSTSFVISLTKITKLFSFLFHIKTVTRVMGSAESGFCCLVLFYYLVLAVLGLRCCMDFSRVVASGDYFLVAVCRLLMAVGSRCRAQVLGTQTSATVAHGLSSCSSWALEHRLSSCRAQALVLQGMGNLPGLGIEPVSPALAGRFFTTEPPGKPSHLFSPVVAGVCSSLILMGYSHLP